VTVLAATAGSIEWQDPTFDAVWWLYHLRPAWRRHIIVRFGATRLWFWTGTSWTYRASAARAFSDIDTAWREGEALQDGHIDVGERAW
jgi:hypothetical protein